MTAGGPKEHVRTSLLDVLDAAGAAARLVARGKEAYDSDEMLRFAAEAIIQRIREAVGRLPESFLREHAEAASWRSIRGMRNFVVHEYQRVDHELLWSALANRLPAEREAIRALLDLA